jgi:hypothetical protein
MRHTFERNPSKYNVAFVCINVGRDETFTIWKLAAKLGRSWTAHPARLLARLPLHREEKAHLL